MQGLDKALASLGSVRRLPEIVFERGVGREHREIIHLDREATLAHTPLSAMSSFGTPASEVGGTADAASPVGPEASRQRGVSGGSPNGEPLDAWRDRDYPDPAPLLDQNLTAARFDTISSSSQKAKCRALQVF